MHFVYILHNSLSGKHYIGYTNNIGRRLEEHNSGQTHSTRNEGTWQLVYKEVFITKLDAHRRERQIKSYKGGNAFKQLIAVVVQR